MDINELLEQQHMTKYKLAQYSNVPYTTLNDLCKGKTSISKCSAETVYKLAKAFHISMEELLMKQEECV